MKFFTLTSLLSTASATVLLSLLPDAGLKIGETYDVEYLLDQRYSLELLLVKKGTEPNIAWTTVKTLFENVNGVPCNGSYEVKPDDTWPTSADGSLYALWISGTVPGGNSGYADLTPWFNITSS